MEVTVSGFHGSFYFGTSEYAGGKENKLKIIKHVRLLEIYKILGCTGFARVDMFYTKDKKIVFNEVNTIPGCTSHSRYPSMLNKIGISFPKVIDKLIKLGLER